MQNRGTVGGNVCVNDPTNHLPPLFAAMGATFTILGPGGERTVSADDFFLGVYMTAVGEGELLTRVTVPALARGSGDAMEGITLGMHGTYIVSAAATVGPGGVRVAIGCVSGVPERATVARGAPARRAELTPETVHAAVAGLGDALDPPVRRARARRLPPAPRRGLLRARRAGGCEASEGMSVTEPSDSRSISVEVNGTTYEREVAARRLLVHFLRDDLDLTGTHIGCDTGNCGACTVQLDGQAVKSCMMLAVQADGAHIRTVEGLAGDDGELTPLQRAFTDHHALQCGYCTPGMLMSATDAAGAEPEPLRARGQGGAAGQHLPLHGLLEHHRGRAGRREGGACLVSSVAPEVTETGTYVGQSIPRKEDGRLVQGQGVFVDDIKRHNHGLHALRALAVRARAHRLGRRQRRARGAGRLRHADGRRGRDPDRAVLPDRARRPAATSRTTRWPSAARASSATPSPPSWPRRASSPATPPS